MSGGLILLYHRVTRLENDPQLLAVRPENFAAHLAVLHERARVMPLSELVATALHGEDLDGAVAITLDDGYADNLLEAKPRLEAAEACATVFVATAGSDNGREFFWDDLDRILLQPGRLPEELKLQIGTRTYETDLGRADDYSSGDASKVRHWNVLCENDPTQRHRVYRELCALIHQATVSQRQAALDELHAWAQMDATPRSSHLMMTRGQLRQLIAGGVVDVGAHTVHHPLLAVESLEEQEREIADSRRELQSILARNVPAFSYPFGGRRDYSAETVAAVRSAGFSYACSNFGGAVTSETDPFQLPRLLVRDWSGEEFARRLEQWRERFMGQGLAR